LLLAAGLASAKEILFDQMVEAGGLKCYPVYGDATSFYYLPDQPHVAVDEGGRPQFSFLMYSSPEARGEEGITSSPGGGVAHMLVAYDVPSDMVRRAQSELQRQRPGAQLKGPVSYTDGTFNLVTSVTDPEAGLSRRVVGVGNAPVMSGHRAAVSMHLTPMGAMLLWESFSQRTPDVSVNFEMTVSGYRNPVEAEMVFDYQRIHQTMELEAGIEASFIEADVEVMLGKMVDNGSIRIELKGAPPEQWQEVQKLGLELAKHHLFENLGATPLSQLREVTRSGSSSRTPSRRSSLDWWPVETIELVTGPAPDEDEARQVVDEARGLYEDGRFQQALDRFQAALAAHDSADTLLWIALCHLRLGDRGQTMETLNRYTDTAGGSGDALTAVRDAIENAPDSAFTSSPDARRRRAELAEQLRQAADQARRSDTGGPAASDEQREAEVRPDDRVTSMAAGDEQPGEGGERTPIRSELSTGDDDRIPLRDVDFDDRDEPELRRIAPPDRERPALRGRDRAGQGGDAEAEEEEQVRLTVSFRLRRIERSGSFTFSMKQWNRVELPVRFAANVGDLSRYMDDTRMFRRVSLNDPMFKQREIPVTVDVASEEAFAAMLNAVTVTLRKLHQSGKETVDEVTIQRSDFSSGEVETLLYGWDGDDDRTRWLEYDQRVRWSYVGGPVIEGDWQRTTAGALVLSPPLRPRELLLEADPEVLREQGVRDVVVEVRYPAGDGERTAHATVRPSDEVGRQVLVLYQDPQSPGYSYSFDWRLYGGRRVEAGPFDDTADYIYLDEIPR
jgi:hypothetical protein